MKKFDLEIASPHGKAFEDTVERLYVPTTAGPVCIMAGHIDFFAKLVSGRVRLICDGVEKTAVCDGGVLSVHGGRVSMAVMGFDWE